MKTYISFLNGLMNKLIKICFRLRGKSVQDTCNPWVMCRNNPRTITLICRTKISGRQIYGRCTNLQICSRLLPPMLYEGMYVKSVPRHWNVSHDLPPILLRCFVLVCHIPSITRFQSLVTSSPTMPRRGPGFMRDEVERLLTSIERLLPMGPYEWDEVVSQHEMYFPDLDRSRDALKRKFSSLYSTCLPTGGATIPPDVLRAKRAYEEIKRKAEISEGEDNKPIKSDKIKPSYCDQCLVIF